MEKVATDIYTFSRLREEGFTYVDKTRELYSMASGEWGAQFFMARPRRFGKSLAVSTLRSLFEGRRDLFQGLAIEPLWHWSKKWPVLHLDMGTMQYDTVEELDKSMKDYFAAQAAELGIEVDREKLMPDVFRDMIRTLAATSPDGRCVVLVDEYDKPLLKALNTERVVKFRDYLKSFYGVIKYEEPRQRFMFMTGVSKFSKVSIFSDLNNLKDWTMNAKTATLFGYTHEEVLKYFPGRIHDLAQANGLTDEAAFAEIVKWYDGYKFEENAKPVINPVSLGLCFDNNKFANYWSQTAMPTFLIDILRRHPLDFSCLDLAEEELGNYEPTDPKGATLLFQTGYLTIDAFSQFGNERNYTLKLPNLEVENSFLKDVVGAYTGLDRGQTVNYASHAARALYAHDVPKFLKALKSFFADIPYDLTDRQNEQMWQTICYVVLRSIGVNVNGEVKTHDGRMDMVADLPGDIYIIEFKLDRPAAEAMEQIRGKDYAGKYALSGKRLTLIGISFSSEKRTIVEELVEEVMGFQTHN